MDNKTAQILYKVHNKMLPDCIQRLLETKESQCELGGLGTFKKKKPRAIKILTQPYGETQQEVGARVNNTTSLPRALQGPFSQGPLFRGEQVDAAGGRNTGGTQRK